MEATHSRLNRIFAIAVFAIAFVSYLLTVSPTVCFWDCGEYVSVGHSLEIPHPPGNPLYIMVSRVVSMGLFFFKDFGYRLNLISCFTSAIMAMLMYLIIVRTFIGFVGIPDTTWKRLSIYIGGIVGGLFAAFSNTVWFTSVEAEVNSPLLVPIALCTWLALVWGQSKEANRDKYLVLASYVAFLGIAVHMYSMITLPPLFLYVIMNDKEKLKDWRLWATGCAMGLVIYSISWFIWIGLATVTITGIMSIMEGRARVKWQLCFFIALFGLIGFSSHLYLPVRSNLNPMIDENHPATTQAFVDYLERKQYGSESMISRMFWRRGSIAHQWGFEGNMGFGGFFLTQFFHFSPNDTQESFLQQPFPQKFGKLLVYFIPVFFMLWGFTYIYKRNKSASILLGSLFLMTSVVLIFYMNFADGTRSEKRDYIYWERSGKQGPEPLVHREVRVRDYFWVAGFAYYGMFIGIASGCALLALFSSRRKFLRTTVAPIAAVLFAASPALPMSQNMGNNSRRGDYVPFDYAYNLLMTCEREGIIFTNGDNDTFPLWALQEAYGIRKDVRIVNLSLVNTQWYIKQLKHLEPKVPISYSDDQIDALNHELNPLMEPTRYTLPDANITVMVPGRQELNALRIQDKMVLNIVDSNKWRKPIYFAVTVSDDNKMGLDPYLQMQGLAYRVKQSPVPENEKIDIARTVHLLDKVYKYRGLGDGKTRLNDTSEKLLSNYAAAYIQIALVLRKPLLDLKDAISRLEVSAKTSPDSAKALVEKQAAYQDTLNLVTAKMDQCVTLMPWDWRPRVLRHEILMGNGLYAKAEEKMREAIKVDPENLEYQKMLAQVLDTEGKKKEANDILRGLLASDPDPWYAHASLAKNYEDLGLYDSAISIMQDFAEMHPGDRRAMAFIQRYNELKQQKPALIDTTKKKNDSVSMLTK